MASPQTNARVGAPGAVLDLHEELSHPPALRCVCGPAHLRLRSEHGELVRPRGGAVNRCAYCARLAAIENCEMLGLDALEGDPATVLLVLTTRTATVDMARFSRGLELVKRALRRRWPACEYSCLVEFTTGYGERSGGLRRPHWNLMFKGVPSDAAGELQALAARIWCAHVDAGPAAQHATAIYAGEGLTRYLALHFQKATQEPPADFTGQRFNCSRAYFTGCSRAAARARARESLALKREVWRQDQRTDPEARGDAHDVELTVQLAYRLARSTVWVLVHENGAPASSWRPQRLLALDRCPDGELRASRTGRMVGAAALPERVRSSTARLRAARSSVLAQLLDPGWLPPAESLFGPGADDRYV